MTKDELKKLLQAIREIEQAQPERGVAVVVKVDNLTKDELKEIIDQFKPKFSDVRELPGSSYKPV